MGIGTWWRSPLAAGAMLAAIVVGTLPRSAGAQSDVALSLDRDRVLVNKIVGDERWLITYDLRIGNVTGNVLREDGTVAFLDCAQRSASVSSLEFACYGAPPCEAAPCLSDAWSHVADVSLPRSFFALSKDPLVGGCANVAGDWAYLQRTPGDARTPILAKVSIVQDGCAIEIRTEGDSALLTGFMVADVAQVSMRVLLLSGQCPAVGRIQFLTTRAAGAAYSVCNGSSIGVLLNRHP